MVQSNNSRPMAGRTVLVTGGSGGIGKATAIGLARMGAHLAITGRDRERLEDAAIEIRAAGGGQVDVFVADLSSQSEVRRLADAVLQTLQRIDVLVNNVGGYWNTRHVKTADAAPSKAATTAKHASSKRRSGSSRSASKATDGRGNPRHDNTRPAACTQSAAVLGHVASSVHTRAKAEHVLETLTADRAFTTRPYSRYGSYDDSKLANVLFTYELARRLEATAVTANALHPGVVRTSFGAEDPAVVQRLFIPFLMYFMKTPAQGAATSIHLASAPDLEQVTGRYFADNKPKRSSERSYDQAAATRLWQVSADLVGLTAAASTPKR